jgi:pimeloyl-ACP methyl ester carboxylesterase
MIDAVPSPWRVLHVVLVAVYLALPLVTLAVASFGRDAHRRRAVAALVTSLVAAIAIGLLFCTVMGILAADTVSLQAALASLQTSQLLLTMYGICGLLLLLRALDSAARALMRRLLRPRVIHNPDGSTRTVVSPWQLVSAAVLRLAVLVLIGLPLILAAGLTYRAKVVPVPDTLDALRGEQSGVRFVTSDGVPIAGWWIAGNPSGGSSGRAMLLCHGLGSGKQEMLELAGLFAAQGYGVLLFDFRAHGESGGQFTSFGDLERHDVLAAVRWIRQNQGDAAETIHAIGVGTGAAALVAAAADASGDGQAIDAIALIGGFDHLGVLSRDLTLRTVAPPLGWMIHRVGLPIASVHSGASLGGFRPADLIGDVWPRPVLVIGAAGETTIPLERTRALYDAAFEPRKARWLSGTIPMMLQGRSSAAPVLLEFFRTARSVPMV